MSTHFGFKVPSYRPPCEVDPKWQWLMALLLRRSDLANHLPDLCTCQADRGCDQSRLALCLFPVRTLETRSPLAPQFAALSGRVLGVSRETHAGRTEHERNHAALNLADQWHVATVHAMATYKAPTPSARPRRFSLGMGHGSPTSPMAPGNMLTGG